MRPATVVVAALLAAIVGYARGAAPVKVELLMDTDPAFAGPPEIVELSPKLPELWLTALARDEVDLKLQAAQAFTEARKFGLEPNDKIIAALRSELVAEPQPPAVRLQMAQALIALDAQTIAADLLAQSQTGGLDLQLVVEPALARWKYEPATAMWRKRLADPLAHRRELSLAIEALAEVGDASSADALTTIALDRRRARDVRLQAARAAGVLRPSDGEDETQPLIDDRSPDHIVDRLVAANLLRKHTSDAAQTMLVALADDPEPAVAAIALEQLLAIDAALAAPLNARLVASRDTKVRQLAVALLDRQATIAAVELLGPLLDDIHPGVRAGAREALVRLAAVAELNEPVRTAAMQMLASDKVRGLEQAALVLGALDHEPAAPRLVALLEHEKPSVFITAAWALRKLAVPDTAAPILAKLHRETEASLVLRAKLEELYKRKEQLPDISGMPPLFDQLAHLIEALGVIGYREALPEFQRFFPKPPMIGATDPPPVATLRQFPLRAAIIDALGRMYAGEPRADLVAYFAERLSDDDQSHPESTQVRANAAVALARFEAKEHIPTLERFFRPEDGYSTLTDACNWSLERLAGGQPYNPTPRRVRQFGWFLEPLDE